MTISFEELMRRADLHAIADHALALGAHDLYDKLVHDAENGDELTTHHLTEVIERIPELANDVEKFLKGIPLSPTSTPHT